jgi:hypothetical protein
MGGDAMTKNLTVHAPQRWEYAELTRSTEKFLVHDMNEQGQLGWELVSVSQFKDRKGELVWTAFLKRPCGKHEVAPVGSALNEQVRIEPPKK